MNSFTASSIFQSSFGDSDLELSQRKKLKQKKDWFSNKTHDECQ